MSSRSMDGQMERHVERPGSRQDRQTFKETVKGSDRLTFALERALACSTVAASPRAKIVPLLPFTHRYSSVTIDLHHTPYHACCASKSAVQCMQAC
jgi:hypothetical protein